MTVFCAYEQVFLGLSFMELDEESKDPLNNTSAMKDGTFLLPDRNSDHIDRRESSLCLCGYRLIQV